MSRVISIVTAILGAAPLLAQVNVLTANYDNERTNSNLDETILNQSNVTTGSFGKIGYFPVDGEIYAQPLYVTGVSITGQGTHNVVYVATMHNSVYAIDADSPNSTTPLWKVNFGPSVSSTVLNFSDILPEVGILSTPVIDPTQQIMYVVSDTLDAGTPTFRLHALSLADGHEMLNGPVVITAGVKGNGAGNSAGTLRFDPSIHLQRPGLALANGLVYLSFGSRADLGNWHGWLMSYSASTLEQLSVLCTSPNGYGASIWDAGRAPAIDSDGNLFVATGNGDYDGTVNFGESVLKLSGKDLTLLDWFTPQNYADLTDNDTDLGSSGVILIPNSNLLAVAGKSGDVFVIQRDSLGHLSAKTTATVQDVQANQLGTWDSALWNNPNGPIIYAQELFTELRSFQIVNGQISATPLAEINPQKRTLYASMAISANSNNANQAIVWWTTGDVNTPQLPGTLHALDASNISNELWNSDMVPTDALGRYAKFVAPTVANGKVYVPTFSNELAIYGLLSSVPVSPNAASPQITTVTNNASFIGGAIAPGELVSVYGANLGPSVIVGSQLDGASRLTTVLAHTKVFMNGTPAPLLFASENQVGAVVPFGISGATAQVQIQHGSEFSTPLTIPVLAAIPALFSSDGTGGNIGAIINQDGNANTYNNPAPKGSVITMWATGLGQMNPAVDGQIVSTAPYPSVELPVTVLIDNQPAQVLYAGAAPGMVQGLVQINARVPAAASSGEVSIAIHAGTFSSPNTVTLIVQ